jgi:uncharacterized membrane protein YkoI
MLRMTITVTLLLIPLLIGAREIGQDEALKLREQGLILSLETILNKVKGKYSGRVIETELEAKQDTYVYEIELLLDTGEVRELKFDAKTGAIISDHKED